MPSKKLPPPKGAGKFPKTAGDIIDRLYQLREEKREAANVVKQCEEAETALRLHAFETLGAQKLKGARGSVAQCAIIPYTVPNVENWNEVYNWVTKPLGGVLRSTAASSRAVDEVQRRCSIFQRRLSTEAWTEFLEAKQPVLGTKAFSGNKLSLTKIAAKGKKGG